MSVEAVLDKLTDHNEGVLGALVTSGEAIHHNFRDIYAVADAAAISEEASQMFELLDGLGEPEGEFNEVFLELSDHSVFAKRIEDGVLVVLNKPVDRRVFRKMQVGVNLFVKPLKRALDAEPEKTADPAVKAAEAVGEALRSSETETPEPAPRPAPRKKRRFYRGVEY